MRPSSIDTSANCGRGSAMRARPSSASSKPSPTEIATTATPSTSAKLLKLMPAANQNWPCVIGNVSLYCASTAIGSDGGCAPGSSAWMNGNVPNCDRSVREHEPAVDAEAAADAGQEERGRPADRAVHRAEREEARELAAVRGAADAVAAEHRQAVHTEAREQHADVLHGVGLARARPGSVNLRRPPTSVMPPRSEAIAKPARSTSQRAGSKNDLFDATMNVSERSSTAAVSPKIDDAPVEQQRDRLQMALLDLGVEADLLDVDGAEALLDREPPRAGRVARPQRDEHDVGRAASAPRPPG